MNTVIRCRKCILPSTTPMIEFDEAGVCNYCDTYKHIKLHGVAELEHIIGRAKSCHNEYDCMVNISGGRDSSYTILKMVKDYGLKVLAVNYQNPFTHPIATQNIENIVKILNVKLISFSFRRGYHENLLRTNLQALLRKPDPALVPMICISCKLIWRNILRIARANKIKLIVSGGNLYEQTSFKRYLLGGKQDQSVKSYYSKYLFGLTGRVVRNLGYLKPATILPTINGYLYSNPYSPMTRLLGSGIEKLDLFHYIDWNESEVLNSISNELDWHSPANGSGNWRFDCRIGHLKDYLYLKWLGLTEKDDFYSRLIREGKINREIALHRIESENKIDITELSELMKLIGLNVSLLTG